VIRRGWIKAGGRGFLLAALGLALAGRLGAGAEVPVPEERGPLRPSTDEGTRLLDPSTEGDLAARFADDYRASPSTGPERFGFDDEGRLVTSSARVALLDDLNEQSESLGDDVIATLSETLAAEPDGTLNEQIVAWRNVARHSDGSAAALATRLRSLLARPRIANEAPFAFLQALDGIVYLRDAAFVPVLAELAVEPSSASPARLALHRLASVNSLGVLRQLNTAPVLLRTLPGIRADLAASIDPSDPDSVEELERYLQRDDVGLAEKEKMIQRMDQPAFVIADGIFTGGSAIPSASADWAEQVAEVQAGWGELEEFRELWGAIRSAGEARR
jgi:hypothetical protein